MEDLAKQNMLQGMSFSWSGLALEEVEAGGIDEAGRGGDAGVRADEVDTYVCDRQ